MWTKDTHALCPQCGTGVPATLFERGGDIHLRRDCPVHGRREVFFWKDERTYHIPATARDGELLPEGPLDIFSPGVAGYLTTLAIDVTTRCNLSCPTCVTTAEHVAQTPGVDDDPPIDELLSLIPDYRGHPHPPNISLIGGESTLREDLPEIIKAIIEQKGLTPRLNTNGLLLGREEKLDELRRAGLRWIILQFDGFEAGPSLEFRGRDLRELKQEVIRKILDRGFFLHLAVMVQKGVNDHELGRILRFAASRPGIRRVSFYPRSHIGRIEEGRPDSTHAADVMRAIEEGTGGQVRVKDILDSRKLGRHIHRLTKNPMFRPRPCIFPFVLLHQNGRLVPCQKLLNPLHALREGRAFLKFARHAIKMFAPDKGDFPSDFLFVNIEKFYDEHAFDLDGARNCHHIYLSKEGALPFCVYNTRIRGKSVLQMGGGCG